MAVVAVEKENPSTLLRFVRLAAASDEQHRQQRQRSVDGGGSGDDAVDDCALDALRAFASFAPEQGTGCGGGAAWARAQDPCTPEDAVGLLKAYASLATLNAAAGSGSKGDAPAPPRPAAPEPASAAEALALLAKLAPVQPPPQPRGSPRRALKELRQGPAATAAAAALVAPLPRGGDAAADDAAFVFQRMAGFEPQVRWQA
ncbi:hypothetical protein MNEG_4922 [Monoraphidium neglectum]|jgi:hypothetical protein|uniref:Uncharacterized protein n=1 Tax=Monoraphidium neglectum TaxID=145388 RepID=A0A0D2L860_9CHLO|nr:hypothetical protein MNEG_4922 [Monoraphidium neglectum]KIZ03034.1 hypothetical protein MNEG_4922 [Monoraphidium neglectum]|eukprot:XP_013902053.1 hypothetical protein MNEG_4922 [Monoraphidium neglectum]